MFHIRRFALLLTSASMLASGCGSNSTVNPFRNFQITDELNGHKYIYDFSVSTGEVWYDPTVNLVYGINKSTDQTIGVGYFGPPATDKTFTITTATMDSNGDGDFFTNEASVALTGDSVGTFSDTGDKLELALFLQPGLFSVDFSGTGDLKDIQPVG